MEGRSEEPARTKIRRGGGFNEHSYKQSKTGATHKPTHKRGVMRKSHWAIVTPVTYLPPLMAKTDCFNPGNGTNLTGTCPLAGAFCDVC